MAVDYEKFWSDMDGYDMTDEQKRDFLDALHQFVQGFVDDAWGISPTKLVLTEQEKKQSRKKKAV